MTRNNLIRGKRFQKKASFLKKNLKNKNSNKYHSLIMQKNKKSFIKNNGILSLVNQIDHWIR